MVLRHPELLWLILLLPLFWVIWWRSARRIHPLAVVLRLLMAGLLVVALADPLIGARPGGTDQPTLVLAVDQSDSLGDLGREELRRRAAQAAQSFDGRVELIYFGANQSSADTSQQVDSSLLLPPPSTVLQADQTNIAAAIGVARSLIGTHQGEILLLTDGLPTTGDALAAAAAAGEAGIVIRTDLYVAPESAEIWLQAIEAPPSLRQGEEFTFEVVLGSRSDASAALRVAVGGDQVVDQQVQVAPGENRFRYTGQAGNPGVLTIRAEVAGDSDTVLRNNAAATTALVAPAPNILIVEGQPTVGRVLQLALQPLSINTDLIAPDALPTSLSKLVRYDGMVLIDVTAGDLSLDQMATIREFVRSEGRGLVATGGRASFTLGSYKGTPLEEVLPVSMNPPERNERPPISLLMIMDQSASMGPNTGDSKFNMAKESAILTAEALRENDRIGLLAFDIGQQWILDFQPVGAALSISQIQEAIASIPLGGGTDILGALQRGLPELADEPNPVRHALLLTDGRSFTTSRASYQSLIERMRTSGMTVSTIAIGSDADTDLLREIAQLGGGRYHFADTPADIPRLTLLESEILRTEPQVEGEFRAEQLIPHPTLRSFSGNDLPALQGYVATTIKPEAEMVLQSPENDPVLAAWQYGLGRAVAWTPGIEAPWASNWSNWPEYGRFWSGLIRYTLPEPDSGPLQLRVVGQQNRATISAEVVGGSGEPLDLATLQVDLTLPDGSARSLELRQVAPGRYAQEVTLPQEGAYALSARATKEDLVRTGETGFVLSYPDEYRPSLNSSTMQGAALLDALQVASQPGGAAGEPPGGLPTGQEGWSLWPWLVALATAFWLLEVAIRRGWLLA
ncbi:MAG: VWA domain-containing protein [Roseiflexaceae bacterium]